MQSEPRFQACRRDALADVHGEIRLVLPQTYMNESGYAVAALARFYRVSPPEILVAHDELDLKPGSVKLKLGGGSAGHNGLKDVIAQLGSGEFWRLRLGIGHPRDAALAAQEVVDYVLRPPRAEESAAHRRRDRPRSRDLAAARRRGDRARDARAAHAPGDRWRRSRSGRGQARSRTR